MAGRGTDIQLGGNVEMRVFQAISEKPDDDPEQIRRKIEEEIYHGHHTTETINKLGNSEDLVENYLRHPGYGQYPVVGVSWRQAVNYCKWRGERVNEKILIDMGVLKSMDEMDSIKIEGANHFNKRD